MRSSLERLHDMTMNFQPQPSANFAAAFQALIDEAMEISAQEREPRDYLGGSRLGVECLRALGYEYHHVSVDPGKHRSEEHTSELQSLMRISYAVFCLKKKKKTTEHKLTKR